MKDIKFKDKIAQGINDLFYIWKREFQTTFRDQGVLIFFILVPLGYPLLYSFIYDNEVVREVPAVVVDDSHSSLSREYLRKVDATPDIQVVAYCADMEEAKQMLKNRLAYGIIYIPSDFSDDIAKGKQTQVSIYCDMSGLLYYKSMLLANTAVSLDMNRDIKIARSGNTTDRQDEITAYPIEYEEISIFNPTAGFAAFLIPAVLVLIIQQTLLLGIGLAAGIVGLGLIGLARVLLVALVGLGLAAGLDLAAGRIGHGSGVLLVAGVVHAVGAPDAVGYHMPARSVDDLRGGAAGRCGCGGVRDGDLDVAALVDRGACDGLDCLAAGLASVERAGERGAAAGGGVHGGRGIVAGPLRHEDAALAGRDGELVGGCADVLPVERERPAYLGDVGG